MNKHSKVLMGFNCFILFFTSSLIFGHSNMKNMEETGKVDRKMVKLIS